MMNKKLTIWIGGILFAVLLAILVVSCEQYDPYKNPRPPSKPEKHREPTFTFPTLPSCSRQPSEPDPGVPASGDGPAFGCTRHREPAPRKPRHQRERPPKEKQNEDGPIYPFPNHIFPFCTDENPFGVSYKSGTKGYAAFPRSEHIGCLEKAPCPTWFYMQIDHPGDLLIYIEQKGLVRKLDVDFACWGPFEARTKKEFLDRLRVSYYNLNVDKHDNHRPSNGDHRGDTGGYPFGNLVDCSFDKAGTEWCYIPDAKTGEWYLLLLTNYSQKKGTVHFDRVANMSTATTNCKVVVPISLNPLPRGLRHIDDYTTAICLYENKALVTIELVPDEGYTLPRNALRRSQVTVFANNKVYPATLKKDHFECEIDIEKDTTEYFAAINCSDPQFDLETITYRIVRSTDCDPNRVKFTQADPYYAGDMSTLELVKGDRSVEMFFSDPYDISAKLPGAAKIDINDYDFSVDFDGLLIERVDIRRYDNRLELTPKLKGDWCDCFIPDTVTFRLRMIPNNGDIHATPYEMPINISVLHKTVWISRCLWVLISIGGLLLFILYLVLLLRKNRFKKNAVMVPTYFNHRGNRIEQGGTALRKQGFVAWFARWFIPGNERNTLGFSAPEASITFVASDSTEMVVIPKDSFDSATMNIPGYNPNANGPVALRSNERIRMTDATGTDKGYLAFKPGSKNDGTGYRMLLVLLIIAAIVAIGILVFMLLRGLFNH